MFTINQLQLNVLMEHRLYSIVIGPLCLANYDIYLLLGEFSTDKTKPVLQ